MARTILLADDSVTAQNMGRKILADAGYNVVAVNNGSAALKRIAENKPDLIVLDVYMPGYSGLEVCQRLKDSFDTAHIPVLLTVGKLEPFKAEEARRVMADAHIVKPFEATELLTAIARLEDHMVPQQSGGVRFGAEGGGRKADGNRGADAGWKSRLGFPPKKEETEEAPAGGSFRDFRKGKSKTGAVGASTVKAASGQEPEPVPGIPRDITPEELDALSALAAKLDGEVPASEDVAPAADKTIVGPVETPTVEPAAVAVEAPAGPMELAAEGGAVDGPVAAEIQQHETEHPVAQPSETGVAAAAVAVDTGLLAQEPGPVDRDDEPMFASAANAEGPAASDEDLAQALRLLTPAAGQAEISTARLTGSPVEVGPRWVAEPVALSREEAATSLEAEMFRTFAAMPAAAPGGEIEPVQIAGVSAIAAAVESRLAEVGLAGSAQASPEPAAELGSSGEGLETTVAATSAAEGPAEAPAAVASVASPAVDGKLAEKTAPEKVEDAPKAMAAAASEGSSSSLSVDASEIASIVDRVMADLRPKIVEEIARKLAGK